MQNDTATFKDHLGVSYKTKHTLTIHNSSVPKGTEYLFHKTHSQMFTEALFITAKTCK